MPVPLSVTNPKAVGLAAAQPAELPTTGPFARLGAQADDTTGQQAPAQQGAAAADVQQQQGSSGDWAVETQSLSFCYPDIGRVAEG
jgi:hypothetical protein